MSKAISNTSPLLYLYRINALEWLPILFDSIITTPATINELKEGQGLGYDVPNPGKYDWLKILSSHHIPPEWYALDLGIDDLLARRAAKIAGLFVWGTLRILIEAKNKRIIKNVKPYILRLEKSGLWISNEIMSRILKLAEED